VSILTDWSALHGFHLECCSLGGNINWANLTLINDYTNNRWLRLWSCIYTTEASSLKPEIQAILLSLQCRINFLNIILAQVYNTKHACIDEKTSYAFFICNHVRFSHAADMTVFKSIVLCFEPNNRGTIHYFVIDQFRFWFYGTIESIVL
jgi:hypothetical protein